MAKGDLAAVTRETRELIMANAEGHPATDGDFWAGLLPGVSKLTVARVMREGGLPEPYGSRWSAEELGALREGMDEHPEPDDPHWAEALPDRAPTAVISKMRLLRRKRKAGRGHERWTAREEDLTRKVVCALAERMGRTPYATALHIRTMAGKTFEDGGLR